MNCKRILLDIWQLRNLYMVPLLLVLLIPVLTEIPESEMPESAARCLYVVIIMAVTWLTESLPISATALIPIVLFPLLGVMTAKATSGAYVNDTSMLFVGGLMVAVAVEEWNLHKRVAVGVMMVVGSDPKLVMAGLMIPTWFLSMWISNTATTSMMIPIAAAVLAQIRNVRTEVPDVEFDDIAGDNLDKNGVDNQGYQKDEKSNGESTVQLEENPHPTKENQTADPPGYARLSKGLTMCIAYAANIGGIATLTGTPPNLVMKGIADEFYKTYQPDGEKTGSPISFSNWMGLAVPLSALVLVCGWILLVMLFVAGRGCCTVNEAQSRAIKRTIKEEWKKLGPFSLAEIIITALFVFLAVLWVSRDPKESPGWAVWFKYNIMENGVLREASYPSDTTSAILIVVLLFILPGKVPNVLCFRKSVREGEPAYTPILKWDQVHRKLPWGVIILLGGGFSLAKGVDASGLADWLADKLSSLDYLDKWVLNLALTFIVAMTTEVTSNTATATLLLPIVANLGRSLGYNPLYFMISGALATSFAFMLPAATPPNAIVFSYGSIQVADMAFAGVFMNLIAVAALTLAVNTWGVPIYDFDKFEDYFNTTITLSTS